MRPEFALRFEPESGAKVVQGQAYVRTLDHDDHPPPHIHVEYQGHEAFIAIGTGEILKGELPKKAARLVKDWCLDHQDELMNNWTRAQALEPLERIAGADSD